uniref:F0F1 ATP synthase subunit A n=1 Tax=Candidatus Limivicinus sp. TaxID=3030905 RepID=UPI003FEEE615
MGKKEKTRFLIVWLVITLVFLVGSFVVPSPEKTETVKVMMRDAVLHEENRCSLFGLKDVSPAMISAIVVSGILLLAALLIRIFAIPRFKMVPGKFQSAIELLVSTFDNLAKTNSPRRNSFLGVYAFGAGVYIFVGTLFELFGVQVMTISGHSVSLPAPLSDVNAAISLGVLSYFVIFAGGILGNGVKGSSRGLKKFSLPLSMSFRLFGALLSGLLVTELVYYYASLSYVLPVIVAVLFTLLHALIQSYVLTLLTTMFYGELNAPLPKKVKPAKA